MRHLIFICWLLASVCAVSFTAHGQTWPAAAPLSDSAAQVARDDTAIALQRLFRTRRHSSIRLLVLGSIVTSTAAYALVTNHPETTYQRVSTIAMVAVVGISLWQVSSAIGQRRRYRTRQEEALLSQLDQGRPLPRWVRRRLIPAYFGTKRRTN
ncbi:MAG TPA: hypothetical protein VF629_16235 [Hymenobacter sp.]|jgi:hypothetical protein|uniref:hypothetical protein n=1 Tax=Hymenobacter sp. TaxID=1898978 RepID=UPI002ED98D19